MRFHGQLRADLGKEGEAGRSGRDHREQECSRSSHGEDGIEQEKERDSKKERPREIFSFHDGEIGGDLPRLPVHDGIGDAVFVPVGQKPDREHGTGGSGSAVLQDTCGDSGRLCTVAGEDLLFRPFDDIVRDQGKGISGISFRRDIRRISIKTAEKGRREILCRVWVERRDGSAQAVVQGGRGIKRDTVIGGVHVAA